MIHSKHPLAVLAARLPWGKYKRLHRGSPLKPNRQVREKKPDLWGEGAQVSGGGISHAGRARLALRLMMALKLLKNSFDLSDEEPVGRFSVNVNYQRFVGYEYFNPIPPCDLTQIGRFRTALGEAGLEELLSATIHTAVDLREIKKSEFKRVIVDSAVQERAPTHLEQRLAG